MSHFGYDQSLRNNILFPLFNILETKGFCTVHTFLPIIGKNLIKKLKNFGYFFSEIVSGTQKKYVK